MLFTLEANNSEINSCIECHKEQNIPSELIYRKYLMKYSSNKIIKDKMFKYLQNPKKENSIMPKQFFIKFPMKDGTDLNQTQLLYEIDKYIEKFNIADKLQLYQER
jgi:hypothetical protein